MVKKAKKIKKEKVAKESSKKKNLKVLNRIYNGIPDEDTSIIDKDKLFNNYF